MTNTRKHYLIIGGSSGIGLETARHFLEKGARVTICGRSRERLDQALSDLGNGADLQGLSLDMMNEDSLEATFAKFADASVDGLIVTASDVVHGSFEETNTEAVRDMFDSKFFGPYRVARAALPKLVDGGSITLFSGVLSRRPGRTAAGLAAVNAAIEGLVRALALELGPAVRVNAVSPGMTRTPAYASMPSEARELMFKRAAENLPAGRVAEPSDIAEAVVFLAGNRFVTGHVLDIDGGHLIS